MRAETSSASPETAARPKAASREPRRSTPRQIALSQLLLKLIAILESNPTLSRQRVRQMLGVSRSHYTRTVARMRRLIDLGSPRTQRFRAIGGFEFVVRFSVDSADQDGIQRLERRLALDGAVERADRIAGAFDYQLLLRLPSLADIDPWRRALSLQPGVIAIDAKPCRSIIAARSEAAALLGFAPKVVMQCGYRLDLDRGRHRRDDLIPDPEVRRYRRMTLFPRSERQVLGSTGAGPCGPTPVWHSAGPGGRRKRFRVWWWSVGWQ